MKAILVNDTRSEGHVGCGLVVENVLRECRRVGLEIIDTVLNSEISEASKKIASHPTCELVLINGEGTMHDDRQKPAQIMQAACDAKKSRRKVVLFNTVWQNSPKLSSQLSCFDLIFCRESLSTESVVQAGHRAQTVPDMIFASVVPEFSGTPEGVVIIDSVKRKTSRRLGWFAAWKGYPFLIMGENEFDWIQSRKYLPAFLKWRTGESLLPPGPDFISRLQRSEAVVSGRFHGTCLAFLLEKPVASISSNTHKIEGLYRDIGLNTAKFQPEGFLSWVSAGFIRRQWAEVREQEAKVKKYVESAPKKISTMFDQIAAL